MRVWFLLVKCYSHAMCLHPRVQWKMQVVKNALLNCFFNAVYFISSLDTEPARCNTQPHRWSDTAAPLCSPCHVKQMGNIYRTWQQRLVSECIGDKKTLREACRQKLKGNVKVWLDHYFHCVSTLVSGNRRVTSSVLQTWQRLWTPLRI